MDLLAAEGRMQQSNCCLTTVDRVAVFACFAKSSPRQRGDEPCSSPQTQASPCTGPAGVSVHRANADARSAGTGQRGRRERGGAGLAAPRLAALPAVGSLWATATGQAGGHSPAATARTHVPKTKAHLAQGQGTAYLMLNKGKKTDKNKN